MDFCKKVSSCAFTSSGASFCTQRHIVLCPDEEGGGCDDFVSLGRPQAKRGAIPVEHVRERARLSQRCRHDLTTAVDFRSLATTALILRTCGDFGSLIPAIY